MACHLFGGKPLPGPILAIFVWNLNQNSIIFIQGNAIENAICLNGSHFVQGRWVKKVIHYKQLRLMGTEYIYMS